jgi:RHS repeat-associated protein
LTDASEVITDDYVYEAFGEEVVTTGATPNPQRFVGRQGYYQDEESGLYSVGQRMFRPSTGRWLSNDPVRDDEENLYRYVGNNPRNETDPSGLEVFVHRKWQAEELAKQLASIVGGVDFIAGAIPIGDSGPWTFKDQTEANEKAASLIYNIQPVANYSGTRPITVWKAIREANNVIQRTYSGTLKKSLYNSLAYGLSSHVKITRVFKERQHADLYWPQL